jgi:hypothetical protein
MRNPKRLGWLCGLLVLLGLLGVAFWQKTALCSWYYTRQVRSADPQRCSALAAKLEALGGVGVRAAIDLFQSADEQACQNARTVLVELLQHGNATDSRREEAWQYLAQRSSLFSTAGQGECLSMLEQMLREGGEATASQILVATRMLSHVGSRAGSRHTALEMTAQLLGHENVNTEALVAQAKAWVVAGLQDGDAATRAAAVRLAAVPSVHALELLSALLLNTQPDSSPEVRELVILALGENEMLLNSENLCRFLNDAAQPVRTATERALRARGLSSGQITLARMLQHPQPSARAEVPALVLSIREVDTYVWLEKLSRDPAPAVRAATARVLAQQRQERFGDLMRHLAETDQDPTVREIARFFREEQNKK